nr:cobalt-precorrin-5B (C(1))-methyltransferase CbiD [Lachnospiraceae bacterium]
DVDKTSGVFIFSKVSLNDTGKLIIEGGEGVGRVTKPGLDMPVGEAAINHVPREMIGQAVLQAAELAGYAGGLTVTVSVPGGEEIARQTFNPQLGIEGGISILGTSGIVEPMSMQALVETIKVEMRQAREMGNRRLILVPGNYGTDFLKERGLDQLGVPVVRCSNFIGEAIDEAGLLGFEELLLAGHIGKLVKLAGGIMNTHSRTADCRMELFCAHAAVCGAETAICRRIMGAATADGCLEILKECGLYAEVMKSLTEAIRSRLVRRAKDGCEVGALVFSNRFGLIGETVEAGAMVRKWKEERGTVPCVK